MLVGCQGNFLFLVKHANITTKNNFRPVSILPIFSKIFENYCGETQFEVGDSLIKNSSSEKLLVVKISFDKHGKSICRKASSKLRALARATPYKGIWKRKLLLNAFFNAHFIYCSLIWILFSYYNNNMIKYLNERCLRLIYNNKLSSYENFCEKMDQFLSIMKILITCYWDA